MENKINKDLILREKLALQRTTMANQSTLLAFIRTALYFLIAGLSIRNLLKIDNAFIIEITFFIASFTIFTVGIRSYYKHKASIKENEKHIGDYKDDYLNK